MKNKGLIVAGLALAMAAAAGASQDRSVTLVDDYARLSARIDKARAAFRRGDLERTEREARFCLDRLPAHHEAHLLMSQVLHKRGEFAGALEHIEAAEAGYLELVEAAAAARLRKMKQRADHVADLIDEVDEAMAAELAAKSRGSCQVPAYTQIVQEAKAELVKEQGWGESDQGEEISGVPALYSQVHGNALFRLGRQEEAEAQYRRAIRADPAYGEAYNNLINILYSRKRLDEARDLVARADAHKAEIHPGLRKAVLESSGK